MAETYVETQKKIIARKKEREKEAAIAKELAKKPKNPVGRPKGGNLAIKKLNDIVENGDMDDVLKALVTVAKDPDHKAFAASQKLLLDRVAHLSNYEKKTVGSGSVSVNINIGGIETPEIEVVSEQ